MKKLLHSKKRGSAIVLAILLVVILLAMGTGLLQLGLNSRIFAIRTSSDIMARCAADAGLTMALFRMNEKKQETGLWDGSTLPQAINEELPHCDATYSYTVTGDLINGYFVKSVGRANQAERTVYATLRLKGVFEYAILTKEKLILKPDTIIDGYNSMDPLDTDVEADISTQSTADSMVVLNSDVTVKGDVTVGVGGNPDTVIKDQGATTGDRVGGIIKDPLPLIPPPPLPDMKSDIIAKGETITLSPANSGQYGNITLSSTTNTGVLEISGGDVVLYITGNIDLGQSCELVIKDNSSLTVYTDGNIHCHNDIAIYNENPPQDPKNFQVYGTSEGEQYFDIKAKGSWSGTIYAPNADISLYAKADFYGSSVCNNFELKAGRNYHYDEALRKVGIEDAGVRFVIDRWYEGSIKSSNLGIASIQQ